MKEDDISEFEKLKELVSKLRGPDGCPWDKKQTLDTMKDDVLGEVEELVQAVKNNDVPNICEEVGDVIWASVLLAKIAEDEKLFSIEDSLKQVNEKIVRRHPHIFGDKKALTAKDAMKFFLEAKAKEKK